MQVLLAGAAVVAAAAIAAALSAAAAAASHGRGGVQQVQKDAGVYAAVALAGCGWGCCWMHVSGRLQLVAGCWLLLVLPRSIRFLQLQPSQKLFHRPRAHY